MTIDEVKKMIGKKVALTDFEGQTFRGVFTDIEPFIQTTSEKNEAEIYIKGIYVGIPLEEIKTMIAIE